MANRNFNKKQALEREVKDLYVRFAADATLVSHVGIKSVILDGTGFYRIILEDKYVSLKYAKAILMSDVAQDVKFNIEEDAVAEEAYITLQALDSNNDQVQPENGSEILLKLELKNSSVQK